uniref:SWIM-type domain-containing protein n=1 Tax=Amphimedon queenslandica TaxID=400682 RepID=A0A1X7VTM0_AMPQE
MSLPMLSKPHTMFLSGIGPTIGTLRCFITKFPLTLALFRESLCKAWSSIPLDVKDLNVHGPSFVPNMKYILKKYRFLYLQGKQTDAGKAKRKLYKRKRKVYEHKAKRLFVQESAMVHDYWSDEGKTPIEKCKCGSTDHKRTTHKNCRLRKVLYGERKSDPAPASDVIITSSDDCHSESDFEQLHYHYEDSADGDDLNVYLCTCPNYPRHKWYCPHNVRNRKKANDGCVTP